MFGFLSMFIPAVMVSHSQKIHGMIIPIPDPLPLMSSPKSELDFMLFETTREEYLWVFLSFICRLQESSCQEIFPVLFMCT
jgi:hypothetical protein